MDTKVSSEKSESSLHLVHVVCDGTIHVEVEHENKVNTQICSRIKNSS